MIVTMVDDTIVVEKTAVGATGIAKRDTVMILIGAAMSLIGMGHPHRGTMVLNVVTEIMDHLLAALVPTDASEIMDHLLWPLLPAHMDPIDVTETGAPLRRWTDHPWIDLRWMITTDQVPMVLRAESSVVHHRMGQIDAFKMIETGGSMIDVVEEEAVEGIASLS